MKTVLGDKITKIIGYNICIISLICFFVLTYLGLFKNFNISIKDIIICLTCAIIFFISASIKGKK